MKEDKYFELVISSLMKIGSSFGLPHVQSAYLPLTIQEQNLEIVEIGNLFMKCEDMISSHCHNVKIYLVLIHSQMKEIPNVKDSKYEDSSLF